MRFEEANRFQRAMRRLGGTRLAAWVFARVLYRLDGPAYRVSNGRWCLTSALTGLPMVELTTTGARSGHPRTMPIVAVPDGDRLVLVASNYGQARHPGWYFNLRAHPGCTVVLRGTPRDMVAYEADGDERERLWALDVAVYPARARYAARAGRRIPVMVLGPVASPATGP